MIEGKTHEEVMESARETIASTDAYLQGQRQIEQNRQRSQEKEQSRALLSAPVPDFAEPLRQLRKEQEAAMEKVSNDPDLSDEARTRKLNEINTAHRQASVTATKAVRDRVSATIGRFKPLARVQDEPTDEALYARVEREFMAKVQAGRIPDLKSYREAVETGDRDLSRVFEVYGSGHISDAGRRREFNDEVENQKQARLTNEQKLARQRIREVESKRDDFEMGLRVGAFGQAARGGE